MSESPIFLNKSLSTTCIALLMLKTIFSLAFSSNDSKNSTASFKYNTLNLSRPTIQL